MNFPQRILAYFNTKGSMSTYLILGTAVVMGIALTGGVVPTIGSVENTADQLIPVEQPTPAGPRSNLQLEALDFVTVAPSPSPTGVGEITPSPTGTENLTPSPTGIEDLTPSPTLPRGVTPTITPTSVPQACLDKTGIMLLVDLSASMDIPHEKEIALNGALERLNGKLRLHPETVIGAYAFGPYPNNDSGGDSSFTYQKSGVKQLLPFKKYNQNKANIDSVLGGVNAGGIGGTYMRNGVDVGTTKLRDAKNTYPGYNFITILLSDGVPEVSSHDPEVQTYWSRGLGFPVVKCVTTPNGQEKCFAKLQDPRGFSDEFYTKSNIIPTLQNQVKNKKVYTIVIMSSEDSGLKTELQTLLQNVAGSTTAPYYQSINDTNYSKLSTFFDTILNGLCD